MYAKQVILVAIFLIIIESCQQSNNEMLVNRNAIGKSTIADSTLNNQLPLTKPLNHITDTGRKFIRTADIKAKVKDVKHETAIIESIVTRNGGFITNSTMQASVVNLSQYDFSEDSSIISITYSLSNTIILRIPHIYLDTFLQEIGNRFYFLHHRVVNSEDVTYNFLRNNVNYSRGTAHSLRIKNAIDKKGNNLNHIISAEEDLYDMVGDADEALFKNLKISDQVKYSTVTLYIYQNPTVLIEKNEKVKPKETYTPGFGKQVFASVFSGWQMVVNIVILLLTYWPVFLLYFICMIAFKRYKKHNV